VRERGSDPLCVPDPFVRAPIGPRFDPDQVHPGGSPLPIKIPVLNPTLPGVTFRIR